MIEKIITIMISVLVVIFGIFIVAKYQIWFIKQRLRLISIFMVLGISVYTIGYLAKTPKDYFFAGLMAIFSAGRMFVFENDISSFEMEVAKLPPYNLVFGLVMTLSMLTTAMIILTFFGYRAMCRIQLGFMRIFSRKKNFYVFTKLNQKVLYLADDIRKQNRNSRILFCVDNNCEMDEERILEKIAAERGYLIKVVNNAVSSTVFHLCKQFIRNKVMVFSTYDEDMKNLLFVKQYAEIMQASKGKKIIKRKSVKPPIAIYTFINNKEYEDLYNDEILSILDIHIINENDLASRQLFHNLTLLSCLGTSDTLTVCVIGYTEITPNLYKDISYLGQCYGVKLKLLIIEEDIQDKTALFFHQNPEIGKCIEVEGINLKPNTTGFYKFFHNNMKNINCVIISNDNIDSAIEISRINRYNNHNVKICVHLKAQDGDNLLFKTSFLKECITFGAVKDIFTESIIINEKLDELAKGFHNYYAQLYQDTKTWNEVCLFEKQSNRALALHIQSKLYNMGLKYEIGSDTQLFDEAIEDELLLENLSKGEHLRWNAYYYGNGWRTMKDIPHSLKNKDSFHKTHACLVDWDELDEVSTVFNKDFKEMDRHLIRSIGNVLKSAGFGVVKLRDTTNK